MTLRAGRVATVKVEIGDIRELKREDLALLAEARPVVTLQSLRDNHHRVARACAAGLKNPEIAQLCGMSINRVSMLKQDPAFMDLVSHYRGLVTAEFVRSVDSYLELATGNMLKAEAMLSDKIDAAMENNEFLPTRDLIAISRDAADRFGYGKRQTNLNVNADFAAMLEAARQRSNRPRDITTSPPLSPIADSPRVPQSALTFDHSPLPPASAPSQFRRRV